MEESTKQELERQLATLVRRHRFKVVMKIGDRTYFRHKDGRSAILSRDHKGDVKLERLDQ